MSIEDYGSELHPSKVFTLERALDKLNRVGSVLYQEKTITLLQESYRYMPQQVFWYNPEKIGISETCFPDVTLENDVLRALNLGEDDQSFDALNRIALLTPVLSREQVLKHLPAVSGLPTTNIILRQQKTRKHSCL